MDTFDRAELAAQLKKDEGYEQFPYTDTVGKITIGVGRNLTDRGLLPDEVEYLLANDMKLAVEDAERAVGHFAWMSMGVQRQRALANMAFQLGLPRLKSFKKMLLALHQRRYKDAAAEARDSKWARQCPERAERIACWIEGIDPGI